MATLGVFLVSGLLHEYVFATALGRVQGYQLAFFSIQGIGVVLTARARPPRAVGIPATLAFLGLTSILFFASVQGFGPFYQEGLPSWLWGR